MAWTTLTMRVTTPLFNGGADAGASADGEGVRAASIRGAMRFWFRALAGALTGPDLKLLGTLERRVFGGIGSGERGAVASPLLLRVSRRPAVVRPNGSHRFLPPPSDMSLAERRRHESRWILYLMGQGLADLAQMTVLRPYIDVGEDFDVKIGFRHPPRTPAEEREAVEGLTLASLWLTCAYGGIGARSRRGFGGVRITRVSREEPLPTPWDSDDALLTPEASYYDGLDKIWIRGPVASCMKYFSVLLGGRPLDARAWQGRLPDFPVLDPVYAPAGVRGTESDPFRSWEDTLMTAGEQLRHFRASLANSGAQYHPPIETPEWVETVHGQETRFPVGALGLPVGMKDNYEARADGTSPGEETGRRASPLWIRAVGSGHQWRLLTFAFRAEFLPSGAHLWHNGVRGKELQITDADVQRQMEQWIGAMRRDMTFVPYRHDDGTFRADESRKTWELHRRCPRSSRCA